MIGGAVGGVVLFALFVVFVLPDGRSRTPVQWASHFDYFNIATFANKNLQRLLRCFLGGRVIIHTK